MDAAAIIRRYYDAFNRGDRAGMLDLLTDDVAHDVNEGDHAGGKEAFAGFMRHMDRCYRERLDDIVVMVTPDGTRGAAEFIVDGTYLATDEGLPEARGQGYRLPAGAFLTLRDGKIARLTTYYNLKAWIAMVEGGGR